MLQQIRERATGWVAVLILGLIALSFVFFGIDFGTPGANVAVRVNGEEIPRYQFENLVRQNLSRIAEQQPDAITPELESLIRAQAVDALVNRELIDQEAAARGFRVSEERLREEIRSLPNFQIGGEFDQQVYFEALQSVGRSPAAFEADMQQDLQRRELQTAFERSAFVTPAEVQQRVALVNETRIIDYLQLPVGLVLDEVEVSEEDIVARYENFPDVYTRPEEVTLQYVELRLEDVAEEIEVDEEDVRAAYAAGLETERFSTPEERRASHILIQTGDETSAAEARAEAQALIAELEAGADFAALAAEHSDDPLSAPEGGDLGWIAPGMLDDALVDAIFETAPGGITGPVETDFGFHVVRVEDVRGGDVTPFEEVRDQLVSELQESRADNLFIDRRETLADLTFQNATSLEPAAEALDLELRTVEGVTATGGVGVAANDAVRQAAFEPDVLEEGLNSGVIELEFGHLVVVRVVDRTPAQLRPLEEVRDSIVSVVRVQTARERVRERGEALAERVRAGESLTSLAEQIEGVPPPVTDYELTRQSREVPTQLVEAVFAAPRPDGEVVAGGVSLLIGDYVVYRLNQVSSGEVSEETRAQVAAQLAQERADLELGAYVLTLRERADVFVSRELREAAEAAQQAQ